MTTVVLSAHAARDVRQARDHYGAIDTSLSASFATSLDAAIDRIRVFPHGAPSVDGFPGMRRARMRRFPYGIFYLNDDEAETAVIVRVLHTRAQHDTALAESP